MVMVRRALEGPLREVRGLSDSLQGRGRCRRKGASFMTRVVNKLETREPAIG